MRRVLGCLIRPMGAVAILAGMLGQAQAGLVVNGGFETGDLSGWTTIGNTGVATASFGSGPTEGTYQALLSTGPGSVNRVALAAFLGVSNGTLNTVGGGNVIRGSAIKQTITASAGEVLHFDVNFLTNEVPQSDNNDFALFLTVNGTLVKLADTFFLLNSSPTSFARETGYFPVTHTVATDGSFTIGFGVADLRNATGLSGLLVDNVRLVSASASDPSAVVPEPSTLAMAGIAGVAGIGYRWRHRKRAATA